MTLSAGIGWTSADMSAGCIAGGAVIPLIRQYSLEGLEASFFLFNSCKDFFIVCDTFTAVACVPPRTRCASTTASTNLLALRCTTSKKFGDQLLRDSRRKRQAVIAII